MRRRGADADAVVHADHRVDRQADRAGGDRGIAFAQRAEQGQVGGGIRVVDIPAIVATGVDAVHLSARTLAGTDLGKNFVLGINVSLMALTFDMAILSWANRRKRALGLD